MSERRIRSTEHASKVEASPSQEAISNRIYEYLPPPEILEMRPSLVDLKRREDYRSTRPGDEFAMVLYNGKLIIVPSWHPLNTTPDTSHATQYGTGSFEGASLEPIEGRVRRDKKKNVIGANLILLGPRTQRLIHKSLPARNIHLPISDKEFSQGIQDLMAVLGEGVLVGPDGKNGRAYVRPYVGPGMGRLGISVSDQQTDVSVEAWHWPTYFSKDGTERAYHGRGLVVGVGPHQRLEEIQGKHSSNYGSAASIGFEARRLGTDEAIILAPYYGSDPDHLELLSRFKNEPERLLTAMKDLAIADGPGEEVMAVTKDGRILLPPMDVNRLGGTTADYILNHLAPALGIQASIEAFSVNQIKSGEIIGLFFAGNASRIAAIGELRLYGYAGRLLEKVSMDIPEVTRRVIDRYEAEVKGEIAPSDPSLLTPIDLQGGKIARQILESEDIYGPWMR